MTPELPPRPGWATLLTGITILVLGAAIVASGAGTTFRPPRPSYSLVWGSVGVLVVALGGLVCRSWRKGRR